LKQTAELFKPMLASPAKGDPPTGDDWIFEPKYDGIRIIALARPEGVALITRNGHDKARGFPDIASRLRELAQKVDGNVVLDGEIVALDAKGDPGRFQNLQGRMHVIDEATVVQLATEVPTAYVVFDILVDGEELLIEEPWHVRRKRLESVLKKSPAAVKRVVRPSAYAKGSANEMLDEAHERRWEGVMAKRKEARYEPGRRTRSWLKLKLENQQEFVIGGWTEPRNTREHFGTLLVGYYDDAGKLVYAGHAGGGFSSKMLAEIGAKLRKIERPTSPFSTKPDTNEKPHWVEPRYVAEIKFNEWTAGGHLRQPIFLGLRDDKDPRDVVREPPAREPTGPRKGDGNNDFKDDFDSDFNGDANRGKRRSNSRSNSRNNSRNNSRSSAGPVIQQLRGNPTAANASIEIDKDTRLELTNLGKVFFPVPKFTKGRLLEFYAEISPYLLPALDGRPLVLKRYPNGIGNEAFYQQKAPDKVPPGIRVEEVADDGIETQRRLIGGSLATLLYIVQLGAISTDPWHSRVDSVAEPDYSIVDLDPGPKATFKRVIKVARWVKEELDELGLHGVVKTSGASGMHVVLPMPAGATYEISRTLAELVARRVNEKHPKETTVHRWVKGRPPDAVYVDYLQNIRGKTVASVYSARAEPHASVSTPLKWSEVTDDLDPRDFTVETLPKRLKRVGDLWALGMRRKNHLPGIIGDAAA
jgi:bifunctional non-homologous end joining protein LigD